MIRLSPPPGLARFASAVSLAWCLPLGAARADQVGDAVVFYLVGAGADSVAASSLPFPGEGRSGIAHPRHPWQWRLFDPRTGRDTLFLGLECFPTLARWDSAFTTLEYATGDRIERVAWRIGARPVVMTTLPRDSALCDFWIGPDGRWHVVTGRDEESSPEPGRVVRRSVATRWDQRPDRAWHAAKLDTSDGAGYGGCFESERLLGGGGRPPAITIEALLASMLIGNHRDSTLSEDPMGESRNADRQVFVRSQLDPAIGLEMNAGFGDTDHAMEPVRWVDRRRGLGATIYREGDSTGGFGTMGQIGFAERGPYVLIAAEYAGGYPAVADLRTGDVLFRVTRPSARAVWVPAPPGARE